jgi:hypothetical protein
MLGQRGRGAEGYRDRAAATAAAKAGRRIAAIHTTGTAASPAAPCGYSAASATRRCSTMSRCSRLRLSTIEKSATMASRRPSNESTKPVSRSRVRVLSIPGMSGTATCSAGNRGRWCRTCALSSSSAGVSRSNSRASGASNLPVASVYLQETRRAVRRPVRRATLRDPIISCPQCAAMAGGHDLAVAEVSMA